MTSFPFCDLLDALRAKQIPIGLSDYQAAARLIDRWDRQRVDELRMALAALLATNHDQVQVIHDTFDALYATPVQQREEPPERRTTWARRILGRARAWHVGVAIALALVSVIAIRVLQPPAVTEPTTQPMPVPAPAPAPAPTPLDSVPPPPPSLPAAPVVRDTNLLPLITALIAVI